MRTVIIIGNSGAARECRWTLKSMEEKGACDLSFKGFLSFEGYRGELQELSGLQLGDDETYTIARNDIFVIGIGDPKLRLKAYSKWKARGAIFLNLIHPSCTLLPETVLGEANILAQGTYLSCNTSLGNANYLNGSVVIGHDVTVGDGNFFAPFSMVLGNAHIGSGNSFGIHSSVLAGARVGNNNVVAPGAYLYKGCRDDCLMAGNPAYDISSGNAP